MLDHIYISVSDIPRPLPSTATLEPLGWRELGSYDFHRTRKFLISTDWPTGPTALASQSAPAFGYASVSPMKPDCM